MWSITCAHISDLLPHLPGPNEFTHWGWVTYICLGNLTIIHSDNGLSPSRHHAIIWTNAVILLTRSLGTNFSEISIEILTFSFMKNAFENVVWEMAAIFSRPQWVKYWVPANAIWQLIFELTAIFFSKTTGYLYNSSSYATWGYPSSW